MCTVAGRARREDQVTTDRREREEGRASRAWRAAAGLLLLALLAAVLWLAWGTPPSGDSLRAPGATSSATRSPEAATVPIGAPAPRRVRVVPTLHDEPPATADAADPSGAEPPAEDGRWVRFRVRDDSGAPVAGVNVAVRTGAGGWDTAPSGADGRARVPRPAGPVTVGVLLDDDQRERYLPVPLRGLDPDQPDVEFELIAGDLVRGRVLGPDDAPLNSAYIVAVEQPTGRLLLPVLTDAEGRFRALLAPGAAVDLRLLGLRRTGTVAAGSAQQSEIALHGSWPGVHPLDGEQAFRAVGLPRADLVVRVTTPDGHPVVGAAVSTRLGSWLPVAAPVRTGVDGRARLEDLPARERTVEIDLGGATLPEGHWVAPAPLHAVPGQGEAVAALRPAAMITGRAQRADGVDVLYCGIEARHGERLVATCTSARDGAFELALPEDAPAPLRLEARSFDRERRMFTGEVEGVWPGSDVTIELHPSAADGGE